MIRLMRHRKILEGDGNASTFVCPFAEYNVGKSLFKEKFNVEWLDDVGHAPPSVQPHDTVNAGNAMDICQAFVDNFALCSENRLANPIVNFGLHVPVCRSQLYKEL